jgi:hypothetical protein
MCLPKGRREGGKHTMKCVAIEKLGTPISYRSGVTELPGLTSDPILAADRRGGILISFGPDRRLYRVINPSSLPRFLVRYGREFDPDRTALAYHPNARLYLSASDRISADLIRIGWFCVCKPTECPYILKSIEPASIGRVQMVCACDTQVENTECRRGSAGVVPRRECIRFDGQG